MVSVVLKVERFDEWFAAYEKVDHEALGVVKSFVGEREAPAPAKSGVVAGLSLLSPATLALGAADPATGEEIAGGARYEARLAPRSLYVLAGEARYAYAHAIGGLDGRRLSLILRDARPPD